MTGENEGSRGTLSKGFPFDQIPAELPDLVAKPMEVSNDRTIDETTLAEIERIRI